MMAVLGRLSDFLDDESGATAIEYGLIGAFVAITAIVGMTLFGDSLMGMFDMVASRPQEAMSR